MATGEDEAAAPLDPAMERVRRKMIRLLAVSLGIMFIGLIAVLAGVVYRAAGTAGARLPAGGRGTIVLPAGAQIRDMALDGERALLRVGVNAADELRLVDLTSGAVLAIYSLGIDAPASLDGPAATGDPAQATR